MTKFVTMVMAVAFTVVFSAAALADGWKIGNWEPPASKAPLLKAVSLNADWGTVASVAPAGCRGMVQHAEPVLLAGCSGSGWFLGKRIMANRKARAQARALAQYGMATGHS